MYATASTRKLYPVIIEKGGDGFGATFPDFPGCVSAGDTVEEAFINAHEALDGHIECMSEDGETIPSPSSIEDVVVDPDLAVVAVMLVGLNLPSRSLTIEVAIDETVLREIDSISSDRSRFLADAARVELARRMAG